MTLRSALMAMSLLVAAPAFAGTPAYITAALANRSDAQKTLDAERKPEEVLTAVGIKPGWTVADIIPGRDQYFDRLFLAVVGDKGEVYAYLPDEIAAEAKGPLPPNGAHPDPTHANYEFVRTKINDFALPKPADMIWIR
jgi:predicted methyltransferase